MKNKNWHLLANFYLNMSYLFNYICQILGINVT